MSALHLVGLREVVSPDSRFGWDFSSFIPDYEGSDECAARILKRGDSQGYSNWFVTPDNNLDPLRECLLKEQSSFVMPTYGIRRGFLRITPEDVPEGQAAFAATLDGMDRFVSRSMLEKLEREIPRLDCMLTGASFVTGDGLRMGKGHGFFDLEWAMMRKIGLADEETDVVAVVHDVQVDDDVAGQDLAAEHDTIVDAIIRRHERSTLSPLHQNRKEFIGAFSLAMKLNAFRHSKHSGSERETQLSRNNYPVVILSPP